MDHDRNAPATKGDIKDLRQEMNERHEILRSEMQHSFDDLKEGLRDVQTELLKAFYSYAQSNDERLAGIENDAGSIKKRQGILESRITDAERRLNTPPPE